MGALKGIKRTMDYAEYGGAPLLGVRGVLRDRPRHDPTPTPSRTPSASPQGLRARGVNEKIEQELSLTHAQVVTSGERSNYG